MDKAHALTDKKLEQMERHLHGIFSRASKEVGDAWKEYMARVDKELKPLQEIYAKAKKSGDADAMEKAGRDLAAKEKEKTIYNQRYKALTESLAKEITDVNKTAAEYINGNLPQVYSTNYNAIARGMRGDVGGVSFNLVDAGTIRNLATSDKTLLPYKYVDGRKDVRWNTQLINSEVLQGILQGESIPKISARLGTVLGMNEVSAIRNARTTVTSAENKGRMDMMENAESKGIIAKKVWLATIDQRTRESHLALNGQEADRDEPFHSLDGDIRYPGDPEADPANVYNCRCTLTYKIVRIKKPKP